MPVLIVGVIMVFFGTLAIYSVSIHESFTLTLKLIASGNMVGDPSNYFYFFRQFRNIGAGLVVAFLVSRISLSFFQKNKNITIIAALIFILQIMVFVPGVGVSLNGARGWINLPVLPSIQPAEFFKLGYVLFLASWLLKKKEKIKRPDFIFSFIIVNVIILFIFLLVPDLGTVVVLSFVGVIMLWYSGVGIKYVMSLLLGGLIFGLTVGALAGMVSERFGYIQRRFTYFLTSYFETEEDKKTVNTDIGRQNEQALMAIGGGGFLGQGYGKGLQKFGYIPEAQSDFIFAAFSEEIGFLGNAVLLSLYFYLCYYFLTNLRYVKDEYNKTIGVGLISLIIVQMFVNIGVNMKIMPNTGLTLPFVSFGGTALMVNMVEIVLMYKILQNKRQI